MAAHQYACVLKSQQARDGIPYVLYFLWSGPERGRRLLQSLWAQPEVVTTEGEPKTPAAKAHFVKLSFLGEFSQRGDLLVDLLEILVPPLDLGRVCVSLAPTSGFEVGNPLFQF